MKVVLTVYLEEKQNFTIFFVSFLTVKLANFYFCELWLQENGKIREIHKNDGNFELKSFFTVYKYKSTNELSENFLSCQFSSFKAQFLGSHFFSWILNTEFKK